MARRITTAREQVEMLAPWRRTAFELRFEHYPDEAMPGAGALNAFDGDEHVGQISWEPDGEVNGVGVPIPHQLKGVGRALWNKAREINPDVHHSTYQTPAGKAWAERVGVALPNNDPLWASTWPDGWDKPMQEDPLELAALGLSKLKLRQHQRSTLARKGYRLAMGPVTLYTKPGCPQCDMTKKRLEHHEIPHQVIDVTQDPDAYHHVTNNLGYSSAPVVEAGDEHWSGFREDRIKGLLG